MADSPSTLGNSSFDNTADGAGYEAGPIEWEDSATVHRAENGEAGGILTGLTTLHRGSFAEMVRLVSLLPDGNRQGYYIEKAGDRRFDLAEVLSLSQRDDFPLKP